MTSHAIIAETRIARAKRLLTSTDIWMAEMVRLCGYPQQPRFNEAFKHLAGITPTESGRQRQLV